MKGAEYWDQYRGRIRETITPGISDASQKRSLSRRKKTPNSERFLEASLTGGPPISGVREFVVKPPESSGDFRPPARRLVCGVAAVIWRALPLKMGTEVQIGYAR